MQPFLSDYPTCVGVVWRSTHKAVHTQGGLWPPQEFCYLRGGARAGLRVEQSEPKQGVVWQSTHKAVHIQGGAHTRQSMATEESCYLRGVRGLAPMSSEASRLSGEAS